MKPIETAPKDGTPVLIFDGENFCVCRYSHVGPDYWGDARADWVDCNGEEWARFNAILWEPLPEPKII